MSEQKIHRCDHCGRRIRRGQHELRLSDLITGQHVGIYHTRPSFQAATARYFVPGAVLRGTIAYPERCGPDQEHCDGGFSEWAA